MNVRVRDRGGRDLSVVEPPRFRVVREPSPAALRNAARVYAAIMRTEVPPC